MLLLKGPYVTDADREGLKTTTLGLEFRLRQKHFKRGDLKIKCLAVISSVYWKSNELSIEGERPMKMPVMESRGTRAQGHTHAEHILGKKERGAEKKKKKEMIGERETEKEPRLRAARVDDAPMTRAKRHSAACNAEISSASSFNSTTLWVSI